MKMALRWYGRDDDPVPIRYIRQIPGVRGIMGLLNEPAGEDWPEDKFVQLKTEVNEAGLEIEVIESVNVHEDIKLGLPSRDRYISNYISTVRMLAKHGVKVIIYNFMPVLDWLRTDLNRLIEEDGSYSMYYDEAAIKGLGPLDLARRNREGSGGFSLSGWEPERMAQLEKTMRLYDGMTTEQLLQNYKYFLDAVIPVCENVGIRLACHPDDPAWPIFGLPRIAHSADNFEKIISLHDSPANALCLCTGSLGSDPDNDLPAIIRSFGQRDRIAAVHVRNIKFLGDRRFRESAHFSENGSFDMYQIMRAIHDSCPDVWIRPDHGRMIWDEQGRPGYGLYDRALGAEYLLGLWEAIDKA